MQVPARLQIILAHNSPQALVIRRGPSRYTAVIGWDRKTDTFQVGQWLKGKIVDADISPNGRYWIYTAMSSKGWQTWTAIAYVPYLKAVDFYRTDGYWSANGRFASDKEYYFGVQPDLEITERRKNSQLSLIPAPDEWYDETMKRQGWEKVVWARGHFTLTKRINNQWNLVYCYQSDKGHYQLRNIKNKREIVMTDWEHADVDGNRLVWSTKGLIMTGKIGKDGLENSALLYDANPLSFREIIAPY